MEKDNEEAPCLYSMWNTKGRIVNYSRKEILTIHQVLDKIWSSMWEQHVKYKPKTFSTVMSTVGSLYIFAYIVNL